MHSINGSFLGLVDKFLPTLIFTVYFIDLKLVHNSTVFLNKGDTILLEYFCIFKVGEPRAGWVLNKRERE